MSIFTFNKVKLCIVTINGKNWLRAKEICQALEYERKTSKVARLVRAHCDRENLAHKYQLTGVYAACTPLHWPKDSQKYDLYLSEEGVYELVFSSQQKLAKALRKHCCNILFPHMRQKVIEEKDTQLALLNDDLTDAEREIVVLQMQVEELEQCTVPHLVDDKKNNGMVIIQKNNGDDYPYIAICGQQGYVAQKIRNKLTDYSNGFIVVLAETPNAIIHYNWLRERGCIEANPERVRHFKLGENYSHQRLMELQDAV